VMGLRSLSFRAKTILGIALIEALLLALLISQVLYYLHDSTETQLQQRAASVSSLVAGAAKEAVLSHDLARLLNLVDETMRNQDIVYVSILDEEGKELARRGHSARAAGEAFSSDFHVEQTDDQVFDVQVPIRVAGIDYGRVELGLDVRRVQEIARDARDLSLAIAALEMFLVALFSYILGAYLTRQLRVLEAGARAVADGQLGYQVAVHGEDELGHTAAAFNLMSRHLEEDRGRRDCIMRSALDAIIMADHTGTILEFNPAAERMTGLPGVRMVGQPRLLELVPMRYREAFSEELARVAKGQVPQLAGQRLETYLRRADGHELPVELALASSQVAGRLLITGYLRDLTEERRTQAQLQVFSRAVEQSPASVVITDLAGTIEYVNHKFVEVTGYRVEEAIGRNPRILKSGLTPLARYREMWGAISSGKEWRGELVNRKCGGELYWEQVSISPLRGPDGHTTHYLAVKEDVTEHKRSVERLMLAASVFTHAREGIMITDAEGRIIEVNAAFSHITGYPRAEVLGQNPRMLKSGRHGAEFYHAMWHDLHSKGHWYGEVWNKDREGRTFAELLTISAVRDDEGQILHYVALFSDITLQKEQQHQLEHIAHFDALTGLPNRVLLSDRLHQAMVQARRRGQVLAVAYLDLDGFKQVNDAHGHELGDQLLVQVARRMREALREGDTIARLGGDEFVAVLIDLHHGQESVPIVERLLSAAALPAHFPEGIVQVSASIGVTFYPQAPEEVGAEQLLRQADQAMYQAKLAGHNRYHLFDAEQDRHVRGHQESLERIGQALRDEEFVLHYQPKVNMRSGEVVGVEALIRWQHPEKGTLAPSEFLPVVEGLPLGVAIGEWVIDRALGEMEQWQAQGLALPVSVNVAARQLQQGDFMERLHALLASHPRVEPHQLELEVLETSALEDLGMVASVIRACDNLGVRFALDDFGTGYSSLTYLKRLQAAQLKIDQSFVRDMLDDPEDLAILDGVLGLATAFRREAVAEGVETVEHGRILLQLGCELAQGFGIARPMPAQQLPEWVAQWRPDPVWREQRALSRDDLPLLYAGVEHRAWIRAIEQLLGGAHATPPPLDHRQCRFGHWLQTNGRRRYANHPAIQEIERLHLEVHELAHVLLGLHRSGRGSEARTRLHGLFKLRDALLDQLKRLTV